jgi:WD40 repeat protein
MIPDDGGDGRRQFRESADERFGQFEGNAQDVFVAPDGKTLVTADRHGRAAAVKLWDVATGKEVAGPTPPLAIARVTARTANTVTLHLRGFKSSADRDRGLRKWRAEAAANK